METVTTRFGYTLLLDDTIERLEAEKAAELGARLSKIILGKLEPDPKDRLGLIAAEIRPRFLTADSEDESKYGIDVLEETCNWIKGAGNVDEKLNSMQDFQSFMKWREIDVGLWFTTSLFLWGCGIYMPPHMSEDPEVRQLLRVSGLHVTLANDIFSYRVEALRSKQRLSGAYFMYNAVAVIAEEKKVVLQTAMNMIKSRLSEMEDEVEVLIGRLQERYSNEDGELVSRLAATCKEMMAGNYEWSSFCFRYNGVQRSTA